MGDSVSDQEKHAMGEVKQIFEKGGITQLGEYFESKLEGWRDVEVNFAITGDSGTGKSSFINSIRGLCDDAYEEGAAKVGVTECTKELKSYAHPTNPKIKFWDLPGIGTPNYPDMKTYSRRVQLTKYDVFLIFTACRFTENDLRLARTIQNEFQKKFFFIRTKIDKDVQAENRKKSPPPEEVMLNEIRRNASERLGNLLSNEQDIFLLSNHYPDRWDFNRLTQAILDALPSAQQESITLSLGNVTRSIFTRKVQVLKMRSWMVAGLSGIVAAAPVPGLSFAVDTGLILREFIFYRKQLGVPDEGSARFALLDSSTRNAVLHVCLTSVKQVTTLLSRYAAEIATEEVARFIPYIGSLISGCLSFATIYLVLKRYLEDVKKVAELCLEQALLNAGNTID